MNILIGRIVIPLFAGGIIFLPGSGAPASAQGAAKDPQQTTTTGEIKFDLFECNLRGKQIACRLHATSLRKDRNIRTAGRNIKLYTDDGEEYNASRIVVGRKSRRKLRRLLIEGIPTPILIRFDRIASTARAVSLLKIGFQAQGEGNLEVILRNISLTE